MDINSAGYEFWHVSKRPSSSSFVALASLDADQRRSGSQLLRCCRRGHRRMHIMAMISRALVAAGFLWVVPALGQSAQDHEAHHPDGGAATQQQPAQPAAPQAGRTGPGMTGGNMMGNMMGMGMQPGAEHVEGRLAFIKAELKITDAQAPQWNAFAEAVRGNAGSMAEMRKSMMGGQGAPATLPERLAREDKLATAHLAALKKTEDAVTQLYG